MKEKLGILFLISLTLATTSCILFMLNDERHFDAVKDREALHKAIDIPAPQGATFNRQAEVIKSTHGYVGNYYSIEMDWEDIKNHYRNLILPQGWEISEETEKVLLFKKDGLTITLEWLQKYPSDRKRGFVFGCSKGMH